MKLLYLASSLSLIALIASSSWASARAVMFTPTSGQDAPSQATGGASRSSLFTPAAGQGAPSQATGGASRSGLFTPTPGNGTPQQATGGASRGNLFTPAPNRSAPQQASGGASRRQQFTPAPGSEAPQQASGAASRVGSYYLNQSGVGAVGPAAVIALLPQNFYGTTVSERPTILVYIPASNAEEAIFSLKDDAGNVQYRMTIPVAGKTGVIPVHLPETAPALTVGKNYQWVLALKVDGQLNPSTPYVDGWVQRIQPTRALTTAMQQQDALKRATALGQQGVWYDCVATLASLHTEQPSDKTLAQEWAELLSSVGLTDIATAPVSVSIR